MHWKLYLPVWREVQLPLAGYLPSTKLWLQSSILPSFNIGLSGFGGSPHVTAQWGWENIAKSIQSANSATQHVGSILSQSSSLVGNVASYQRRKDDWDFQAELASKEIDQIERQIAAAKLRLTIAQKELDNHNIQIENARATE